MKVRYKAALCCIEGGGLISGCSCSNPIHEYVYRETDHLLPGDEVVPATPTTSIPDDVREDIICVREAVTDEQWERLWVSLHGLKCNPVMDEITLVMQEIVAILCAPKIATPPASDAAVPAGETREGCIGTMNPARATYFLERFKREEKWLGPHEQWALDYTIAMLAAAPKDASDTDLAVENAAYLSDARWWLEIAQGKGHGSITEALEAAPHASKVASDAANACCNEDGTTDFHRSHAQPDEQWMNDPASLEGGEPKVASDTGAGLGEAAQFLSDRLDELEWMDDDLEATLRDFMGHVDPAHARLKLALAANATGGGEVQMLRQALAVAKRAILKAATDTLWCDDSPAETVVDRIDALIAEADGQKRLPLATTPGGDLLEQAARYRAALKRIAKGKLKQMPDGSTELIADPDIDPMEIAEAALKPAGDGGEA